MRKLSQHKGLLTVSLLTIAIFGSAFFIKHNSYPKDCIAKEDCPREIRDFDNKTMLWESLPQQFISINLFN